MEEQIRYINVLYIWFKVKNFFLRFHYPLFLMIISYFNLSVIIFGVDEFINKQNSIFQSIYTNIMVDHSYSSILITVPTITVIIFGFNELTRQKRLGATLGAFYAYSFTIIKNIAISFVLSIISYITGLHLLACFCIIYTAIILIYLFMLIIQSTFYQKQIQYMVNKLANEFYYQCLSAKELSDKDQKYFIKYRYIITDCHDKGNGRLLSLLTIEKDNSITIDDFQLIYDIVDELFKTIIKTKGVDNILDIPKVIMYSRVMFNAINNNLKISYGSNGYNQKKMIILNLYRKIIFFNDNLDDEEKDLSSAKINIKLLDYFRFECLYSLTVLSDQKYGVYPNIMHLLDELKNDCECKYNDYMIKLFLIYAHKVKNDLDIEGESTILKSQKYILNLQENKYYDYIKYLKYDCIIPQMVYDDDLIHFHEFKWHELQNNLQCSYDCINIKKSMDTILKSMIVKEVIT